MRGFYWSSKAWYADTINRNDIMFGNYGEDDDPYGEMCMVWDTLDFENVPQLQVYNDAWAVLNEYKDVLEELAKVDNKNITEEEFIGILLKCGFKDLTPYESPYKEDKLKTKRDKLQKQIEAINQQLGE